MMARLHTFPAFWRRFLLVALGSLTYVTLVEVAVRMFPPTAASPGYVRHVWMVLVVLEVIAIGVLSMMSGGRLIWEMLVHFFILGHRGPGWAERSDKAKEKTADSLMSVGNALSSATVISLLVVPFTAFVQAIVNRTDLWSWLSPFLTSDGLSRWQGILLGVLFVLPFMVGTELRRRALTIYDEIARPDHPAPPLAPNGATATTRACPMSADTPTP